MLFDEIYFKNKVGKFRKKYYWNKFTEKETVLEFGFLNMHWKKDVLIKDIVN